MNTNEGIEKVQKKYEDRTKIETTLRMSEDRKWFLITRTETTFYPFNYVAKVVTTAFGDELIAADSTNQNKKINSGETKEI